MAAVERAITTEQHLHELLGEPAEIVRVLDEPTAFLRSHLWDPERYADRGELPSAGEIHRSLDPSVDAEAYDAARAERLARRENFY